MPDLLDIYENEPAKYDLLVSREDYQGNLPSALNAITSFSGSTVIEFGAVTGRVTGLLAPLADSVEAFDSSEPMLAVAARRLGELGLNNWRLGVADHRRVPAQPGMADISIAGWSICCLAVYTGADWARELDAGLGEMIRVVRQRGLVIIIETLGTGFGSPRPPESMKPYFARLSECGFRSTWTRTDYLFQSAAEAEDLTTFFFGDGPVAAIQAGEDGFVLPECTGIWWNTVEHLRLA
jgi:ubiquinone/menaquinone biosynthesis C-methylase UbiE